MADALPTFAHRSAAAPSVRCARLLLVLATLSLCARMAAAQDDQDLPGAQPASQPHRNVLLIIGDDLGVDRIASYAESIPGAVPAVTKTIDELGARGVRFTRAYSQQLCSPSRAAMLTGQLAFRTGIGNGFPWEGCESSPSGCFLMDLSAVTTLPQALSATHATAAFGKWHLSTLHDDAGWQHPIEAGFDYFSGAVQNLPESGELGYYDWERNRASALGNTQDQVQEYATSVNVDDAILWIDSQGDRPWFVWMAFNAAHTPLQNPPGELVSGSLPDAKDRSGVHRAMIEAMDTEMARLLSSIPPDVLDETWVIFVGDNGDPPTTIKSQPSLSWPPRAKPTPYEGNVRVPLIVVGPGVDAGLEVSSPVHLVDVLASVCEMAGVSPPPTAVDSLSFKEITNSGKRPSRDVAYGERFAPNGFGPYTTYQWYISDGRWKVGNYTNNGSVDLPTDRLRFFDLDADLFEEHDLLARGATLDPEQQVALDFLLLRREQILAQEPEATEADEDAPGTTGSEESPAAPDK